MPTGMACNEQAFQVSGGGGIPAFGLEPKFAFANFHGGYAPLAAASLPVTPAIWENSFPRPF